MPNFPTSLDTLTNPTSGDTLDSPPHATQHTDANDILEAVETKLGTGASVPTTTGHVLTVTGAGATAYQAVSGAADTVARAGSVGMGTIVAGEYLRSNLTSAATTTFAITLNRLYGVPILVGITQTFDRISMEVTTGAAGNIRLGLYTSHATTYLPDELVVDGGTIDANSVAVQEVTISESLVPGLYWGAFVSDASPTIRAFTAASGRALMGAAAATDAGYTYLRRNFSYAALPDPFGGSLTRAGTIVPIVALRAA